MLDSPRLEGDGGIPPVAAFIALCPVTLADRIDLQGIPVTPPQPRPPAPAPAPAAPPRTTSAKGGAPATEGLPPAPRALPVDNTLTKERIAAYQVAMERMHFSCGFIDGDSGMRTERALRAFQESRGLPITGVLDDTTRAAIGEPGEPFMVYTVTAEDMAMVVPSPKLWREKAKVQYLGYNTGWEMLGEKFHCAVRYIQALNPDVKSVGVGTQIIGPKVFPANPLPKPAYIRITLREAIAQAMSADGKILAHFPCSIAKNKEKRPVGEITVLFGVKDPDYTFDPKTLAEAAAAEQITKKMMIPPGPNNPVGTAWISLSLPGYGMHGTPEPEAISRTQSHGCFRLANWNADKMRRMIKPKMVVQVIE
ncbi:murein L,D-transpeptidase [Verrucomicrobia bacterium LW23]|nr:murein L,D-transpeptidase [Verrucomicrobia bacterium LW23]